MRTLPLLFVASLLTACATTSATEDGVVDLDKDGFAEDNDCNDSNAQTYPGAPERCDGQDNDCDDEVDEEPERGITVYQDADGDGFGNDTVTAVACLVDVGWSAAGGDCDDTLPEYHPGAAETDCADPNDYNCDGSVGFADLDADGFPACEECDDQDANVNPDAEEVCNDLDDDCDGLTDPTSSTDAGTWYLDRDADGYGDDDLVKVACDQPDGTSALGGDCHDLDAAYNPGATESCEVDVDYNCDGSTLYEDADGDGTPACLDCNDGDAAIHPGALEVCNAADDDCDGDVDEDDARDASTWYTDADGDTFGDASTGYKACSAPEGMVADATDCDDTDEDVFPGSVEYCGGGDEDCDGEVDEITAADAPTWYLDRDDDGHGNPDVSEPACSQPEYFVADGDDCDDRDPDENPEADEVCDGDDDDCDGEVDEDDAVDAETWYLDADDDSYGDAAETTSACERPDGYVPDATDCDDDDAFVNPGATESCGGADEDCDGFADDADDGATGTTDYYSDLDGDGYGDRNSMGSACEPPEGTVPNGDDCDDTDITENPGAIEICDGDDDDCDGEVDESSAEDALTFYADVDGDGYGDPGYSVTACSQPSGFVDNTLDCDDLERRTNPGAIETCDGYDNDCDYYTDEGDAADASTWYADSDSDGFGDRDRSQEACDAPDGYVGSDDDCDDADSARNPRATETCNDLDDDCDGSVDEDASDPTTWYLDADGDGYGTSSVSVAVCDRPGSYVEDDQDCNDLDVSVYPGAYDAPYDGVDSGCDGGSDYDADGDGYDSDAFGGTDCDDTDETIHEDCGYTSMTGSWAVPSVSCAWNLASAEPGGEANCPGCEFSFVTVSELAEGDCLTPVDAAFGYDQDVPELSFAFEYYAGYYLQLGPFYAALTPGVYYDRLDWSGYSYVGYYYYGSFYLY